MPEISRPSTAPGTSRRPSGPRRTWLLVLPLLVWAGLAVVTVFVHRFVPEPRWLLVHVPALGLVTHAILVFMNYFADALLHAPRSSTRRTAWLFVPLDAGILLVVAGMLTGRSPWLLVTGGVLVAGAVLVDVGVLARQLRRSLRSRFALSLRYYLAAGTCLGLGVAFGVVMGITGEERGGFWLTHVSLMLLGWVGLTIAGTLLTFFPTVWRTRIPAGANADFARAWWWLVTGLLVMSFSGWFSTWLGPHAVEVAPTSSNPFAWTFLAGTVLHLVGVIQVTWVCVRALDGSFAHPRTAGGARTAAPSRISFAPVSITLGLVWWVVTLAMLLGYGVFHPTIGALAAFGRDLTAPFLVGFVLQVVMGALSHLLAVLVPGGPATTKLVAGIMDAGRWSRLGILNLCGTVFLLPVPSVVKVTTSFAVFGVLVAFLVLLVRALLAARRATRRTVSSPEAPTRSADPAGSAPVGPGQSRDLRGRRVRTVPVASPWKGLASGLIGSVAVLALAVSTAATIDPVSVTGGAGIEQGSGTGQTTTVHMSMVDMTFSPSTLEVPAGNRLVIEVSNDDPAGQVHDLTLANGATSGKLSPGESATVDAGVITEDMEGWCAVAGHRQMGMTFTITATGGTSDDGADEASGGSDAGNGNSTGHDMHTGHGGTDDPGTGTETGSGAAASGEDGTLDANAALPEGWEARDARLPDTGNEPAGTVHRETLTITEQDELAAPGLTQDLWTFNGTAPGPTLRGKVGDTFEITLVNEGTVSHGIDFHASFVSPDDTMKPIPPGESLTYTFEATAAGFFLYHCSTMPMSLHIANGMFGGVVIEPPEGLPAVDEEYFLVQSEQYFGPEGGIADADKIAAEEPDAVVFNGFANQYVHDPLEVPAGDRVRVWVLAAGPQRGTSFHVVGGQFDTVWKEGVYEVKCGEADSTINDDPSHTSRGDTACTDPGWHRAQALDLSTAQGGFVELTFTDPGTYSFVDHAMVDAERGARGLFVVG